MILDFLTSLLFTFWEMLCEMAPYLLLGFFIAGLLHVFVPRTLYARHLSKPTLGSVIKSALFGVPLPLCSCGVIPTAMSLRREGASRGATVSFLISTPQTGVDSIAATYSMMGLPFAIIRPVVAFVTAIFGGAIANISDNRHPGLSDAGATENSADAASHSNDKKSFIAKIFDAFRYGFVDMMQDIGRWLVIGLAIAALITVIVPQDFFASLADYPLLSMLLVLAISVPMYLCATGSIPIAVALMLKGLSPGAALVLLMAGPATNAASILMVYKVLGRATTAIYLTAIIIGSMAFGLIIDYLLPAQWFTLTLDAHCAHCVASHATPWVQYASAIILSLLLVYAIYTRTHGHKHRHHGDCSCECQTHNNKTDMLIFKIDGMMCNHCRTHVEKAIASVPGVKKVDVDLASGTARVEGDVLPTSVMEAVTTAGYTATLQSA